MNHSKRAVVILLVLATLVVVHSEKSCVIADDNKSTAVEGNNAFALDLYAKLKNQEGNLFFSPFSISTALAMTYAGARGNTETQMANVLRFDLPQEHLHPTFAALVAELNADGKDRGYQLSVANALWGQKGYDFLQEFLDLTNRNYGAGLNEVDFKKAYEAARKTINAWVENETQDKIKDLIQPGILNPLTRLVLTNAIYFKGDWASQFETKRTENAPFFVKPDKKVTVSMMHQVKKFKYVENDSLQAVELPYSGDELSMVIFLPKEMDGLPELEKSLTSENIRKWMKDLHKEEVYLYLPRFTMTSKFSLGDILISLGMTDAFSQKADFSGMNGRKDLLISKVLHKAFVDINEEGTEAAAATAVVMEKMIALPPIIFRADHPFVFMIRDNRSGGILFLGRVTNPKGANSQ